MVALAHNVLQLMAGGFLANKVCSRLTLGAVSGALAFTVKLLKKKKRRVREPFKL
jgi:hypothetical protein